jgi:hypothetical protein
MGSSILNYELPVEIGDAAKPDIQALPSITSNKKDSHSIVFVIKTAALQH